MNLQSSLLKAVLLTLLLLSPSFAGTVPIGDLVDLPLESLMELQVTSVSKKSQPIAKAAAAVFVITQEDIRRSGVTTIADALRMAPGVQVARIDSNKWAITSRGFNGRFANKLLVLMDGRSLYTPYFMGVYWEIQDTILDDIDRIEIIRGPGAALWGANAVNGVINIITKSAEHTNGSLLTDGRGTYEKAIAAARVGTSFGETTYLRLYAKHNQRDDFKTKPGSDNNDQWHTTQGGFRLDSQPSQRDAFTLQGDYYDGRMAETYLIYDRPVSAPPLASYSHEERTNTAVSGGNILGRWKHSVSDTNNLTLQMYFDHSENGMLVSPQIFNTLDLDFQQRITAGTHQEIIWGLGYRHNKYGISNYFPTLHFDSTQVTNDIYSAFIHDEFTLIPSKVSLILGSRFEYNDYSGYSIQPNGRLLWTISPHNSLWGSVSRAVRSSTKGEQEINYNYRTLTVGEGDNTSLTTPLRLEINGNPNFKSEELLAYEIGYRTEMIPRLSFDTSLYYNEYKNLRVISKRDFHLGSYTNVQQFMLTNDMYGRSFGVEMTADWTPLDWWRIQATYSYQHLKMKMNGTFQDNTNMGNAEGDVPHHQTSLRSGFDLRRNVTLDLWLRGTGRLASIDNTVIPGYVTMDVRLAWKPVKNIEFTLVGQNLLQSQHPEFIPEYINTLPSEVVRGGYGKVTWKF